ncbi:MAG: hypothetical protein LBH59_10770 [Planctomycetaceae bacterium]|nr:hypothetical protein [Planctomycetaceae bacterium]
MERLFKGEAYRPYRLRYKTERNIIILAITSSMGVPQTLTNHQKYTSL